MDLCDRKIVSYKVSDRPTLKMVTDMLRKAFEAIPDGTNLILHSDQGWHYQHRQYRQMLRAKGIWQSMSRKGSCTGNAVVKNFFRLLKSELFYLEKFQSMEQFKQKLVAYLAYCNTEQIQLTLGSLATRRLPRKDALYLLNALDLSNIWVQFIEEFLTF